jgi:DNA-binding NarL/FixJ family response regulator
VAEERGFQFFKPARENGFGGRVLVVAAVLSVFEVRRLVQAGAAGAFLKQNSPNLLVDAIRAVMGGQLYIDPALQDYFRSDAEQGNSPEALTSREQAVLSPVVEGLANKKIAGARTGSPSRGE